MKLSAAEPSTYSVLYAKGGGITLGDERPRFAFHVPDARYWAWLQRASRYRAALAFIRGEFDIEGDLVAAVAFQLSRRQNWRDAMWLALALGDPRRMQSRVQSRHRAARNIQFHYDRSNEFYHQFLDQRMVYSCAWFQQASDALDQAQLAKLDLICRKLDLRPGEQFLDIGCGWGALPLEAAGGFGAISYGCTLSQQQARFARERIAGLGLQEQVQIHEQDFRAVRGRFDKIASVGMFEHVGRRRLHGYFRQVYSLLAPDGLFLNHGIIRPQHVRDGAESVFLRRHVFPGGELAHLSDVVRIAEEAGFEVLDVENLRPHYALTCRAWVGRLLQHADACQRSVGARTYRTWLLYLAASAHAFEAGATEIHQILLAKRGAPRRLPLSREYMYANTRPQAASVP